jgi:hypothetical protein
MLGGSSLAGLSRDRPMLAVAWHGGGAYSGFAYFRTPSDATSRTHARAIARNLKFSCASPAQASSNSGAIARAAGSPEQRSLIGRDEARAGMGRSLERCERVRS